MNSKLLLSLIGALAGILLVLGATSYADSRMHTLNLAPSPTATPMQIHFPQLAKGETLQPTPTPTPIRYEGTGGDIPDYPNGSLQRRVDVERDIEIRSLRVFVFIEHEDMYDLRIELISPTDDVLLLQGEKDEQQGGPTELRSWFYLSPEQLAAVKGKTARGTWTLRITDTKSSMRGSLILWALDIFP